MSYGDPYFDDAAPDYTTINTSPLQLSAFDSPSTGGNSSVDWTDLFKTAMTEGGRTLQAYWATNRTAQADTTGAASVTAAQAKAEADAKAKRDQYMQMGLLLVGAIVAYKLVK